MKEAYDINLNWFCNKEYNFIDPDQIDHLASSFNYETDIVSPSLNVMGNGLSHLINTDPNCRVVEIKSHFSKITVTCFERKKQTKLARI